MHQPALIHFVRILLAILCVQLAACGPGGPPPGFRPAQTASGDATRACPDLAGAYSPGSTAWLDEFIPEKRPAVAGALSAIVRKGPTHHTLTWQGDRDALLAHARDFALTQPAAYPAWRSLVLRENLSATHARDEDAYQEAVTRLGPSFGRMVTLATRQCADHWMLVGMRTVNTPSDSDRNGETIAKEEELWLSRSEAGELLLRKVTYDLLHYSIWAASSSTLRIGANSLYDKWPAAGTADAGPLRPDELPPAQPPTARETCRLTDERLNALLRRIKPLLPQGVLLESLDQGYTHGVPGPGGRCGRTPLSLTYRSANPADGVAVRTALQADSALSAVEPVRPAPYQPGKYVVRMMAKAE
ncbi:MAG: hypothetical protein SF172_16830 [Burkholderiales bacterium]|nr:hypothetical protein [Burkholderiales bacterium]